MGNVSLSRRETQAEKDGSTQVVAENGLKTRKAEAVGLGLGVITCGYRIFRYPVSSGENRTVFEIPSRGERDKRGL